MTSFLSNSCLSGHRPKRYMNANIHSRPDIISKLMRERQVSRFLVAPSGYGKTYVALEYAQMLFDFQNTCWLECKSPCFLRDLDSQNLADSLMSRDANLRLVVFDDVGRLGNARADALSDAIDALLEHSVEIIVTCKPACDAFSGRQIDRICLSPQELLLSDTETEQYKDTFTNIPHSLSQQNCFQDACCLVKGMSKCDVVDVLGGVDGAIEGINAGLGGTDAVFDGTTGGLYNLSSPSNTGKFWQTRIPLLAWGGSDAVSQFAFGFAREDVPDVVATSMFLMLILERGNIFNICERLGLPKPDINTFAYCFPHLGINEIDGDFSAINMSVQHIVDGFSALSEKIISRLSLDSTDDVAWILSEILLEFNRPARACEMACFYATKAYRTSWLIKCDRRLFQDLCVLPAYLVAVSTKPLRGRDAYRMEVILAWCYVMLGEVRTALKSATIVASANTAPIQSRAWSLVLLSLFASDTQVQDVVAKRICALADVCEEAGEKRWESDWYVVAKCISAVADNDALASNVLDCDSKNAQNIDDFTQYLAQKISDLTAEISECAQFADIAFFALVNLVLRLHESNTEPRPLDTATLRNELSVESRAETQPRSCHEANAPTHENEPQHETHAEKLAFVCSSETFSVIFDTIKKFAWTPKSSFSMFYLLAYQRIQLACDKGFFSHSPGTIQSLKTLLTEDVVRQLKRAQLSIEFQQQHYRIRQGASNSANRKTNSQNKLPHPVQISDSEKYPMLTINIFGGFELMRDGVPITSKYFGQAKVRAMLTLLVLNGGREYSRDRLIEALWPLVNEKSGVKNLYSCWSSLMRGLSLSDGSCPYVKRVQGSYKIDKDLVKSDVSIVNSLCKKLTIDEIDSRQFCEMLDELNVLYKGDLLPSESKNEVIMQERRMLRLQVTDTFLNSVARLIDMDEMKMALWFARVAYSHDNMREDVYYALMSAQLACGQREAALETYFSCTRMLAKHFRMNPSDRMMSLYKSIVECEEVF